MINDCLKTLLEEGSEDAERYFQCGEAFADSFENYRAIEAFTYALQFNPKYAAAFHRRGMVKRILKDWTGAISDYDEAIKINKNEAIYFNSRGNANVDLGNYKESLPDFDEALRLAPNYSLAYNNRALSLNALGELERAMKDVEKAIQLDPKDGESFSNRGLIKLGLKDFQGAIKDLNTAIIFFKLPGGLNSEAKPLHAHAFMRRGIAYARIGDKRNGIKDAEKAIELDPAVPSFYFNLGLFWHEVGDIYKTRQNVLRYIYFNNKIEILRTLKELFHLFYHEIASPFIVRYLLNEFPETKTQISYYSLVAENNRNCYSVLTWMSYIDLSDARTTCGLGLLVPLLNIGMGDTISAYRQLDALDENEHKSLALQYFLMTTSQDILHDERRSISMFAREAALRYEGNDAKEWFYAGRILEVSGNFASALMRYDRAGNYWPAVVCKAVLTGVLPQIENNFQSGLPTVVLEKDCLSWTENVETAVLFYELEEYINRCYGRGKIFPRFWEIWDVSNLIEPIRLLEKNRWEANLIAVLQKHLNKNNQEKEADSLLFSNKLDAKDRINQLKNSVSLLQDICDVIQSGSWSLSDCKALILYFYLEKTLPTKEVFYLYFYAVKVKDKSTAVTIAAEEAFKLFVTKEFISVCELNDKLNQDVSELAAAFLVTLLFNFLKAQNIPIAVSNSNIDYEQFKSMFGNIIWFYGYHLAKII